MYYAVCRDCAGATNPSCWYCAGEGMKVLDGPELADVIIRFAADETGLAHSTEFTARYQEWVKEVGGE